jgi:hypothetical protein
MKSVHPLPLRTACAALTLCAPIRSGRLSPQANLVTASATHTHNVSTRSGKPWQLACITIANAKITPCAAALNGLLYLQACTTIAVASITRSVRLRNGKRGPQPQRPIVCASSSQHAVRDIMSLARLREPQTEFARVAPLERKRPPQGMNLGALIALLGRSSILPGRQCAQTVLWARTKTSQVSAHAMPVLADSIRPTLVPGHARRAHLASSKTVFGGIVVLHATTVVLLVCSTQVAV